MNVKLDKVYERFPGKKHYIEHLTQEDPDFLSLCDDYVACVDALAYWNQSTSPEAGVRIEEYQTLVRELGLEIKQAVEAAT